MNLVKALAFISIIMLINIDTIKTIPTPDDIIEAIKPQLHKYFPNPETSPGVSFNVYYKGKIYATVNHGLENIKTKKKITNQTVFGLASISKMFTGAAVLTLIEQDKLRLTDKVSDYLPKFQNAKKYSKNSRPFTINDLVTMSSGLIDYCDNFEDLENLTNDDVYNKIVNIRPVFEVGTKNDYCNTDYNLLATIVERISGKSYDEYLKEKFFNLLGMTSTFAVDKLDYIYEYVQGYEKKRNKYVELRNDTPGAFGDGNVYTTSDDFERWENMWYSHSILTEETINKAYSYGRINNGKKVDYNFGWEMEYEEDESDDRVVSHEGGWDGYTTAYTRFVDRGVSYSMFSNIDDVNYEPLHKILKKILFP